jgi:hypothetical protein
VISPWFSDKMRCASSGVVAPGTAARIISSTGAMASSNSIWAMRSFSAGGTSPGSPKTRSRRLPDDRGESGGGGAGSNDGGRSTSTAAPGIS